MSYKIRLTPAAARQFRKIARSIQPRIATKIDGLAEAPRPSGCKHLADIDAYRVRVGEYRIIYRIEDGVLLVTVIRIGDRRDVYRMLSNLR